jgi:uncharacterized protein YebE (UPF0316 family)
MAPYLITLALAVGSVALWTVRVATAAHGTRAASAIVSMVEATSYVVAVSHLMRSLDEPIHVAIYAIGVGSGTYVGLTLEARLRSRRGLAEPSPCA